MQRFDMQDVGRVLGQELPVGARAVLLHAADDMHALLGLIDDDVDVVARAAKIVRKADGGRDRS